MGQGGRVRRGEFWGRTLARRERAIVGDRVFGAVGDGEGETLSLSMSLTLPRATKILFGVHSFGA